MFDFLVSEAITGVPLEVEKVIAKFGLTGRIVDVRAIQTTPTITDETKSTINHKDRNLFCSQMPAVQWAS